MKDLTDFLVLLLFLAIGVYAAVGVFVGITWPFWVFFDLTLNYTVNHPPQIETEEGYG